MKKIILLPLISVALIGCGSDNNSSTPSNTQSFDGIYANNEAVMLVDTALTHGTIASNGTHILSFDSFTKNDQSVTFKGSNLWTDYAYSYDSNQTMTALFNDNRVQTSANINGVMFTYDLSKQPASLPLAQLVGSHTDGTQVTEISADGTFISYGNALGCTYDGTLKMTKSLYYSSNVEASLCNDALNNGSYNGYFFTVNKLEQPKLLAVFHNVSSNHIIWGETSITQL